MEGRNDFEGFDTSGLDEDTFGIRKSSDLFREENADTHTSVRSQDTIYQTSSYEYEQSVSVEREGRGLEIATLVFGILSVILCCCNSLFAIIGLSLGIVAMKKGKKSGMTIAGIVCSVIGLSFSLIAFIISFSDYGQELKKAFVEGYESATEVSTGKQTDDEKEYTEGSVKSHERTGTVSDKVAGRVVIDGKEIFVPCKFSELLDVYEISDYSKEDVGGGLGSYESKTIFLAEHGEENGLCVDVQNYTEKDLKDIKDAPIGSISIDENFGKQVEVFGGLALGMTEIQVEERLSVCKYNKSEMSGYTFYNAFAGEDSEYSVSLMLSDGVVTNITLYYSGL